MQGNKPYISTGLRHIFAIVSSQISTVMEPVNAIWKHEPANWWLEISPRDISFLSSLSIIHAFPEYWNTDSFNFVRCYVIIHQKIDVKRSSTYRCPCYRESKAFICWTNKKKLSQDCLDCWDRSFTNSCGPQRKRFYRGKNRKKLSCFLLLSLLFKHFGITKHWNYRLHWQLVV